MAQEEYEEKDLRTHIYETTDTYAGSDQMIKAPLATMKEGDTTIKITETDYIPVIYKMFDDQIRRTTPSSITILSTCQ